jgi:hypothetical protein
MRVTSQIIRKPGIEPGVTSLPRALPLRSLALQRHRKIIRLATAPISRPSAMRANQANISSREYMLAKQVYFSMSYGIQAGTRKHLM